MSNEAIARIKYCPEHGDLLNLTGSGRDTRSIRCQEAHTMDEIRALIPEPPTEVMPTGDDRFIAVRTGSPEVRILACADCGVLLWDADKHYAIAHPSPGAPEPPTDDEREALAEVVLDRWRRDNDTIRRGEGGWMWRNLAESAVQEVLRNRHRGQITEADVDLAYEAFVTGPTDAKASMRAALEAVEAAR